MSEVKVEVPPVEGGELTVLQGSAAEPIQKEPRKISFVGTIGAPAEFLRVNGLQVVGEDRELKDGEVATVEATGDIFPDDSYVIVNLDAKSIELLIGKNAYYQDSIKGALREADKLSRLQVNSTHQYRPRELALHLKKNKFLFADASEFSTLFSALNNFSAKIQTIVEDTKAQDGTQKQLLEKSVEQTVPSQFTVKCPLFQGEEPVEFVVELYATVTTGGVTFTIESFELIDLIESEGEKLLAANLVPFEEFDCPILRQ